MDTDFLQQLKPVLLTPLHIFEKPFQIKHQFFALPELGTHPMPKHILGLRYSTAFGGGLKERAFLCDGMAYMKIRLNLKIKSWEKEKQV